MILFGFEILNLKKKMLYDAFLASLVLKLFEAEMARAKSFHNIYPVLGEPFQCQAGSKE